MPKRLCTVQNHSLVVLLVRARVLVETLNSLFFPPLFFASKKHISPRNKGLASQGLFKFSKGLGTLSLILLPFLQLRSIAVQLPNPCAKSTLQSTRGDLQSDYVGMCVGLLRIVQ